MVSGSFKVSQNGATETGETHHVELDTGTGTGTGEGGEKTSKMAKVKKCCRSTFSVQTVASIFPIIKWLPKYRFDTFQSDLIAGLTVGLTIIPQALAYAQIADLAPQYGLYSSFLGCFVYTFMGTSKDIALGPSAILGLLTAAFGTSRSPRLPNGESDPHIALALTLFCGVIQIAMGILKLGMLVNYISYPVINAFSSAAAITIAVGQVKTILGLKKIPNDFLNLVYEICRKLPETRIWDMTMGLVSLAVVILLKKLRELKCCKGSDPDAPVTVPVMVMRKVVWLISTAANAIVVISGAGLVAILESYGIHGAITPTGNIKAGLPDFGPPKLSFTNGNVTWTTSMIVQEVGIGIIIVPIIALVEAMAIGKAFARINGYKLDPTQELLAIGVSNVVSCFAQAHPVTGAFSRTAVNSQSGVKTPLGGVYTGSLVILALLVLTPWFYYIPKAALAAVIVAAVIPMIDYSIVLKLWRANKFDLLPFFVTFICSLVVGIEYGILIGIGVNVFMLLYPTARPKVKFVIKNGVMVVNPSHGWNFPAAEYLELIMMEKAQAERVKPKVIVLNLEHMSDMDFTAVQSVRSLMTDCGLQGMKLVLANPQSTVAKKIKAADIKNLVVKDTVQEAVDEYSVEEEVFSIS